MFTTTQSHSYLRNILTVCAFNLLYAHTTSAQADETVINTTLTLRPLSELTELALLNSPELKNNQVDYARQTLSVKLQQRSWLDNISVNTNTVYGNGSIADANNNGTTTAYVLSDRKSLNYNVGFGIRIIGGDLINRGNKVELQRLQLDRIQNDRLIVESHIREIVLSLYTQLELVLKIVKLRGDVVENQRLTLEIADKYYKEGKYKPSDYSTLLDKMTAAQEQYEQAKADAKKLALLLRNIVNVSIWK